MESFKSDILNVSFNKMNKKRDRWKRKCYVCGGKSNKELKVALHMIPNPKVSWKNAVYKKWLYVLNLDERTHVKHLWVCSKHFLATDFMYDRVEGRIRPTAVPSVGVPNPIGTCIDEQNALEKETIGWINQDTISGEFCDFVKDEKDAIVHLFNNMDNTSSTEQIALETAESSVEQTLTPSTSKEVHCLPIMNNQLASKSTSLLYKALQKKLNSSSEILGIVAKEEALDNEPYTWASLAKDLSCGGIPQHWDCVIQAEEVLLKYSGDFPNVVTRSLTVKDDMTVKIRAGEKLYTRLDVGVITCKKDICVAMEKVSNLFLCTGYEGGECAGEGFLEFTPCSGKCNKCLEIRKRQLERNRMAFVDGSFPKAYLKEDGIKLRENVNKVATPTYRLRECVQVAANSQDDVEDPLQIDEMKPSSFHVAEAWKESSTEKDPLEIDPLESDVSVNPDTITNQTQGERETVSSLPHAVPRYVMEIMRRSRREMKNATESLQMQKEETELLHSNNERLLEEISDLKRQLEQQQSSGECKQVEHNAPASMLGSMERMVDFESVDIRFIYGRVQNHLQGHNIDVTAYSLKAAERDLRNLGERLPPFWLFTTTPKSILLLFANNVGTSVDAVGPVSRIITVRPDMHLDIQVRGTPLPKLNLGQMKCVMDIVSAMKTVACTRLCLGVNGNCVAEGFITDNLQTLRKLDRCDACRNAWKRLTNRKNKEKRKLIANAQKKKGGDEELNDLKRKLDRLEKEAEKAEQEITRLKQENLALKQRISLETENINGLPVQKEGEEKNRTSHSEYLSFDQSLDSKLLRGTTRMLDNRTLPKMMDAVRLVTVL